MKYDLQSNNFFNEIVTNSNLDRTRKLDYTEQYELRGRVGE